jgi:hypothetical protein
LTWGDFTELPSRPPGEIEDAQIHTEAALPDEVTVEGIGGRLRVVGVIVTLRIINGDTWVVGSQKSDSLLNHEQGHFDITGLLGHDMARQILNAKAHKLSELQQQMRRVVARSNRLAARLTEQYDGQTDHGLNEAAQRRWDDRIQSSIRSGRPLAPP